MSTIDTMTIGLAASPAPSVSSDEALEPVDDRWPLLATVTFVIVASGGLWSVILLAVRAVFT